jgi:hypothetical protein
MARSTTGVTIDRRESVRSKRRDINDSFLSMIGGDAMDRSEYFRSDRSDLNVFFLSRRGDRREPVRSIMVFDKLLLLEAPGVGL